MDLRRMQQVPKPTPPLPPVQPDELPTTKGERSQRIILDAARKLFIVHGYHGTSIRELATEAGLTIGAVYNHFGSKEAIFDRVFAEHNPFQVVPLAFEAARGETIEQVLRDAARQMGLMLHQRRDLLRLVFIELLEFNGRHIPPFIAQNAAIVEAFLARLSKLSGMRLRPYPPLLLMRTFLGLLSAWFLTGTLFQKDLPPSLACLRIEDAVDVFLHGALEPTAGGTQPSHHGE